MDDSARVQLAAVVQDAFRKIFIISGAVACVSLVLAALISDAVLDDRPVMESAS
jgi:DMSO/TMAO reductase YedYZ heme-binding membrane subunit